MTSVWKHHWPWIRKNVCLWLQETPLRFGGYDLNDLRICLLLVSWFEFNPFKRCNLFEYILFFPLFNLLWFKDVDGILFSFFLLFFCHTNLVLLILRYTFHLLNGRMVHIPLYQLVLLKWLYHTCFWFFCFVSFCNSY